MPELKTSKSLLEALELATKHALTPEELKKQRISFILGMLKSSDKAVTRAEVEKILAEHEGKRAA